jgi:hypothetical protein
MEKYEREMLENGHDYGKLDKKKTRNRLVDTPKVGKDDERSRQGEMENNKKDILKNNGLKIKYNFIPGCEV